MLSSDQSELSQFVQVLFRYAHPGSFVSLRSFDQTDQKAPPFEISGHQINGSLEPIVQAALAAADRAANDERPVVFAPPIATFTNARRASVADLANGLVLSVELDEGNSVAALRRLESILGFATCVVESGSTWMDPETGEITPKVHMHWRLSEPTTTGEEHAKLREARNLAALLVGADPTGKPVVHPLRWPGSWNRKQAPRLARISAVHEAAEINLDDALERLREAIEAAGVSQAPVGSAVSGKPEAPPDIVIAALAAVPNPDLHYDEWIRIGYATMRAMGGDERAFETFDGWSRKSDKYQEAETAAAWKRIHRAIIASPAPVTIGAGTIFFFARRSGWKFPEPEAPEAPEDPGWWHSLERSLLEDQSIAEVAELPREPQTEPPQDSRDGLVINPPVHWTAPAPLREWLIQDWIPIGYVTGLYGDGGVGKSLIAQQLLTSVSVGMPWLGMDVRGGRAFGFMCEDDASELHRRQEGINRNYGVDMPHLENLRIAARLGFDNLLMTFDQESRGKLTDRFAEICKFLDAFRPRLVVLDTLADIFGGNEINRTQARQFIQGVGGQLARQYGCAVVIPAHPSASGLSTGSGTSGSTAWNNTFRSRLYITRPDDEEETDKRLLSRMKSNYAPKGAEITAMWDNGAFTNVASPKKPKGIPWEHIEAIFREIDAAWKKKDPWSSEPQTKRWGRYIPLWAATHLGVKEKTTKAWIEGWLTEGYLKRDIYDGHGKKWGLRVVRWLQPEVSGNPSW